MLRVLCAAIGAAFMSVFVLASSAALAFDGHETSESAGVYEKLRGGGYVLVMRHANSPGDQKASVGLSQGCRLAPGRGLDATGFHQARSVGEMLAAHDVPILRAYTSIMCRAWDTASLAAGEAPVEAHPSQISTDPEVVAAFKAQVAAELAANPGTNIILASHSNIAPLYGAIVEDGEEELPQGIVNIVDPVTWNGLEGAVVRLSSPLPETANDTMSATMVE